MSWIDKTGWSTGDMQKLQYTTTTTDTPFTIKAPNYKTKEPVTINSPIDSAGFINQGWFCPKCGRVNAPWMSTCPCYSNRMEITCTY